jgi:hypothetical protein
MTSSMVSPMISSVASIRSVSMAKSRMIACRVHAKAVRHPDNATLTRPQ